MAVTVGCCSASFPDLAKGTSYSFTVTATNATGTGPASAPSNAVTPSNLWFGSGNTVGFNNVPVGITSDSFQLNMFNSGTVPAHIGAVTLSGSNVADFVITADTCSNTTLNGGNNACHYVLTFTPPTTGARSATLAVASDVAGSPQAALQGTGTGPAPYLSIDQQSLNYPPTAPGTSSALNLLVTNRGQQSLTIFSSSLAGTAVGDFTITADGCTGRTLIAAPQNCTLTVSFSPHAVGFSGANMWIPSNSDSNPLYVGLNGSGALPPTAPTGIVAAWGYQSAQVRWDPSGDPNTVVTVTISPGGQSRTNGCCYAFFQGLTDGTSYTFTVQASNQVGSSAVVNAGPVTPSDLNFKIWSFADFGAVPVGITSDVVTINVYNNTGPGGGPAAHIGQLATSLPDVYLITGDTCSNQAVQFNCSFHLAFRPGTQAALPATLTMPSDIAGHPQVMTLLGRGTGPAGYVSLNPGALYFSNTRVGTSPSQTETVTNRGQSPVHLGTVSLGPAANGFSIAENCSGVTLAANGGSSCAITVTFAPAQTGNFNSNVQVPSDADNNNLGFPVGGDGIVIPPAPLFVLASAANGNAQVSWPYAPGGGYGGQVTWTVTASPGGAVQTVGNSNAFFGGLANGTSYTFSVVATGPAGSSAATVSNAVTPSPIFLQGPPMFGQEPVAYATITGPNATDFVLIFSGCASATVYPGPSCTLGVAFRPGSIGVKFALLNLPDDAPGSPRNVVLVGEGIPSGPVLSPSPSQLSFGSAPGQASASAVASLTNIGSAAADFTTLPPQALLPAGDNASDFSAGGTCANSVLAVGATCTVSVVFTPTAGGNRNAFIKNPWLVTALGLSGFGYTPAPAPDSVQVSAGDGVLNIGVSFQGGTPNLDSIFAYRATAYNGTQVVATTTFAPDAPLAQLRELVNGTLHGWATGNRQGGSAAILVRTADGGITWSAASTPPVTMLNGIASTDSTHVWAVGGYCPPGAACRPVTIASTDGGVSWSLQMDGIPNGGLGGITFADANHGWAVGFAGQVFSTADGAHWTQRPVGSNATLSSASFADLQHGWIGGGAGPGFLRDGVILATTDGGNTWTPETMPALTHCATTPAISGLQFVSPTAGWAVATAQCVPGAAGNLISTTDGGHTWSIVQAALQGRLRSLRFLDAAHGWIGGESGVIEQTANGGSTWAVQANGNNLRAVGFGDRLHGVATGNSGEAFKTSDGGSNWTLVPTPTDVALVGVAFSDSSHVFAVGSGGEVLLSTDGGGSWAEGLSPTQNGLTAVGFADPSHGWAVGSAGTVLGWTGTGWAVRTSGSTADLTALAVLDAQHAWAAGGESILATADGATWTARATIAGASLNSLAFTDLQHGWAVGAHGAIFATTDGGTTWTAEPSGTGNNLLGVGFSDPLHGWAVGTLGVAVETVDGGAHWAPRPTGDDDYTLFAIRAFNPGDAIAVGSGARVYGWTETPTLLPASLTFSSQLVGTMSSPQSVTLTAVGSGDLRVQSGGLAGSNPDDFHVSTANCSGGSLHPGATCTIGITFAPTAPGTRTAILRVADDGAGSPQQVALTGSSIARSISLAPSALIFGEQQNGTTSTAQVVSLRNTGTATVNVASIAISNSLFTQVNGCPSSLEPGVSCSISVSFAPTASGSLAAVLTVTDDAPGGPHTVSLTGTGSAAGTPAVSLDRTGLTFAAANQNTTSAAQDVTVTNSGTAPLLVSRIAVGGDFAQTNSCPGAGAALPANATCVIHVTFTPIDAGTRSGRLILVDNASSCSQGIPLSGFGNGTSAPGLRLDTSSLVFGCVPAGSVSPPQPVVVTNTTAGPLVISLISTAGNFLQTNNCPVSPSALAAGATCTIQVSFAPPAGSNPSLARVLTSGSSGGLTVVDGANRTTTVQTSGTSQAISATFYFAEGSTIGGFQETLYLLSPTATGMAVVTYYGTNPGVAPKVVNVGLTAGVVRTVNVNDPTEGIGPGNDVSIKVVMPAEGVAERVMHFNTGRWHGSTDQVGTAAPNTEWDFAEGSTQSIVDEYLTLQNPQSTNVVATLKYLTTGNGAITKTITLGPNSRTTIPVFSGDTSSSTCGAGNCGVGRGIDLAVQVKAEQPIIAERPMYVNGAALVPGGGPISDGHDVFGANAAAPLWNFAEGSTQGGISEYLTIGNANNSPSSVNITYLYANGAAPKVVQWTIPANGRQTVFVNDDAGAGNDVSVKIDVLNGVNVFAERPMYIYRNFPIGLIAGAHDVVGSTSAGRQIFGFAAASTAAGNSDYLTVENPGNSNATLNVTYYPGGAQPPIVVAPHSRYTIDLSGGQGPGTGIDPVGVVIRSDVPVIIEKPTYSTVDSTYGATDASGYSPPGGTF